MMPTLPFDMIVVILLMLPTKTLVKFQCICKAWRNLIRDPMFIKKHFQIRVSKGNGYLLYTPLKTLLTQTLDIEIPFELVSMSFIIVGSSNGLLCLTDTNSFGTTIYMCNPSIRQYRVINFPITDVIGSSDQSHVNIALGFGYYDETNDYKIVRIASPSDEDDIESSFNYEGVKSKIEVYSLITNSWKNIEVDYFPWDMFDIKSETVVSESVHWKAIYRDTNEDILVILVFHLGKEVFQQLSLPNYEVDGEDMFFLSKVAINWICMRNLSLFLFHLVDQHPQPDQYHLWVMKEYTKMLSITVDLGVVIPIIFTKNDEITFEDGKDDLIVLSKHN
ncbi:hypothetical protein Pfo_005143 [Paulownia fortunei]|nr:hypothetical protein Pfo_005143 [Paulownia fortunei]